MRTPVVTAQWQTKSDDGDGGGMVSGDCVACASQNDSSEPVGSPDGGDACSKVSTRVFGRSRTEGLTWSAPAGGDRNTHTSNSVSSHWLVGRYSKGLHWEVLGEFEFQWKLTFCANSVFYNQKTTFDCHPFSFVLTTRYANWFTN